MRPARCGLYFIRLMSAPAPTVLASRYHNPAGYRQADGLCAAAPPRRFLLPSGCPLPPRSHSPEVLRKLAVVRSFLCRSERRLFLHSLPLPFVPALHRSPPLSGLLCIISLQRHAIERLSRSHRPARQPGRTKQQCPRGKSCA
jgi:hypothetical protein